MSTKAKQTDLQTILKAITKLEDKVDDNGKLQEVRFDKIESDIANFKVDSKMANTKAITKSGREKTEKKGGRNPPINIRFRDFCQGNIEGLVQEGHIFFQQMMGGPNKEWKKSGKTPLWKFDPIGADVEKHEAEDTTGKSRSTQRNNDSKIKTQANTAWAHFIKGHKDREEFVRNMFKDMDKIKAKAKVSEEEEVEEEEKADAGTTEEEDSDDVDTPKEASKAKASAKKGDKKKDSPKPKPKVKSKKTSDSNESSDEDSD